MYRTADPKSVAPVLKAFVRGKYDYKTRRHPFKLKPTNGTMM